jgi:hypothetical protein
MANPLYNNGDYYIGVDGNTYYYQNGKWQQWLFEGAPIGGKLAIPPTGAAAIASGAFVPAAGQEETIKVQSKEQPGGNAANPNGALRYPSDPPIAADADYVCFDFYEYTPPFKNASASDTSGPSGTDAYKQYNAIEYTRSKGLPAGTILLYMPEDISTGYKSNWTGKNFSNIGAGLLKTSGEEGILGKLQSLEQTASGAAQRFTTIAGAQLLSAAIGKITGESIGLDDVFGSTRGVILNPNTELLFTGLDLRNFTLTYKLVPRSAAEATIIEKIIRTFKMCSLPSAEKSEERLRPGDADIGIGLGEGFNAGFIKVPDLVKVTFMNGSNPHEHLPKFKMCALTQVDINYTPDGTYATTRDARMVAYQLSLNFQETKLIYREDAKQGY